MTATHAALKGLAAAVALAALIAGCAPLEEDVGQCEPGVEDIGRIADVAPPGGTC